MWNFVLFPEHRRKYPRICFIDSDLQKFLKASFFRKFLPFFQNSQNDKWQILRYFKNLILNPNISKTTRRINLEWFLVLDASFLSKHDFFQNFWLCSFSRITSNMSLTKMPTIVPEFSIFDCSLGPGLSAHYFFYSAHRNLTHFLSDFFSFSWALSKITKGIFCWFQSVKVS